MEYGGAPRTAEVDGKSTNTDQIAEVAVNLNLGVREAGNTAIKLLILGVSEKNHCADAVLSGSWEFLNRAGSESSTLASQIISTMLELALGLCIPVTTDSDLGARALVNNAVDKRGHVANVLLAGSAGEEVVGESGGVFNTLDAGFGAGISGCKTRLEVGPKGANVAILAGATGVDEEHRSAPALDEVIGCRTTKLADFDVCGRGGKDA